MTIVLLSIAAAVLLVGPERLQAARAYLLELVGKGSPRQLAAAALVAAAVAWHYLGRPEAAPAPEPTPAPPAGLDLRGVFRGPTAAEDAATIGGLCLELADEIDWDGAQAEPFLKTGVAFDELRTRARELRCRGVSIGERQPAARDAIHAYLDQAVGVAGGPVSPEQRQRWVNAFRDVGKAATDAAR